MLHPRIYAKGASVNRMDIHYKRMSPQMLDTDGLILKKKMTVQIWTVMKVRNQF